MVPKSVRRYKKYRKGRFCISNKNFQNRKYRTVVRLFKPSQMTSNRKLKNIFIFSLLELFFSCFSLCLHRRETKYPRERENFHFQQVSGLSVVALLWEDFPSSGENRMKIVSKFQLYMISNTIHFDPRDHLMGTLGFQSILRSIRISNKWFRLNTWYSTNVNNSVCI